MTRVLIVKFSSIGDCVMAVPVASRIRRSEPGAFIAWAVDPRCAAVLETKALVNLRYDIPWEDWKRRKVGTLTQLRHYLKLREYKFDLGIDLQGHAKTAICLRLCGASRRISSLAIDPLARALNPLARRGSAVHTVERNLETLAEVFSGKGDASPIMPSLPRTGTLEDMVTISVGTGHPSKNYARWAEVADLLLKQGQPVAFLGGPGEVAPSPRALDLVGKLTLEETMARVVASRVHLAADTGSGHIAAAYRVPVVSVFGYTNPDMYRPYTELGVVLDAGKEMAGVTPEQIVEAACAF